MDKIQLNRGSHGQRLWSRNAATELDYVRKWWRVNDFGDNRRGGELSRGQDRVEMPTALERKLPSADHQLSWQYLFASSKLSRCPRTGRFGGLIANCRCRLPTEHSPIAWHAELGIGWDCRRRRRARRHGRLRGAQRAQDFRRSPFGCLLVEIDEGWGELLGPRFDAGDVGGGRFDGASPFGREPAMGDSLFVFDGAHGHDIGERAFADVNLAPRHDRPLGELERRKGDVVIDDRLIFLVERKGPLPLRIEQEFERTILHPFDILAESRFDLFPLCHALPTAYVDDTAGLDDAAVLLGQEAGRSFLDVLEGEEALGQGQSGIANLGIFISIAERHIHRQADAPVVVMAADE